MLECKPSASKAWRERNKEGQSEEPRPGEGSKVEEGKYYVMGKSKNFLAVSGTQSPVTGCLPWLSKFGAW